MVRNEKRDIFRQSLMLEKIITSLKCILINFQNPPSPRKTFKTRRGSNGYRPQNNAGSVPFLRLKPRWLAKCFAKFGLQSDVLWNAAKLNRSNTANGWTKG